MVTQVIKHFLAAKWRWHRLRTKEALARYQQKKVSAILAFAQENSRFYAQHWQGLDLNIQNLPLTHKDLMMQNFDDLNTVGLDKARALELALQAEHTQEFKALHEYTVGLSSGTSGTRGLFVLSQQEQAMWTGVMLARVLPSLRPHRVALFLRANSRLYENVKQGRWLSFRYFDLMQDLQTVAQELNSYQPTLLVAPPSRLEDLARLKETGKLKIQPQRLISVAEVLEPQDKQRLEQVFGVSVHQIYQATEGLLAISCKHGRLHIQEDLVKIEFETLQDDLLTPIVTDLYRKTQPIIRYRLGDLLRLSGQACPCGQPWKVIAQIEGRVSDSLTLGHQTIFPYQVRTRLLGIAGLKDYRVIQESEHNLNIYLEVSKNFEEVANSAQVSLGNLLRGSDVTVNYIHGLPHQAANLKRRRVIRKHDTNAG